MLEQLKQVGMTYWSRPRFWWLSALYLGFLCLALPFALDSEKSIGDKSPDFGFILVCLYGSTIPFLFFNEHILWQFNHYRARLLPNFNRAHLTFTALTLLLSLVALPALFSFVAGEPFLPLMTATAIACAAFSVKSTLPAILILLVVIFNENGWVEWLLHTPDDSNRPVLLFLLIASWTAIGHWLYRLGNRHEEQPGYGLHVYVVESKGKSRTFRNAANLKQSEKLIGSWLKGWQFDRSIERVLTHAGTLSKWRLLRLGNLPSRIGTPKILSAYSIMLAFLFFTEYRTQGNVSMFFIAELIHSSPYILWILTFIGAAFCGAQLCGRSPQMVSESLFPLTRKRYFDSLLTGLAADALHFLATFHLVLIALLYLPLSAAHPPPTIATCLAYLWISIACAAFTFSFVFLLTASIRGLAGAIVTVLICAGTTGAFFSWWIETRETAGDVLFLVLATGLMGIAWYFIRLARRLWAYIELGDTSRE